MSSDPVFIPHRTCTVTSGECFGAGRCLDRCKKRNAEMTLAECRKILERIAALECRVAQLERPKKAPGATS